jgi:hypothetical protein
MNPNWAEENLQTIRTLMERSALYRRALAPIMIFSGVMGVVAATVGILFHLDSMRNFGVLWLGTAVVTVAGAFFIARRQAVKDSENFWSPPTRRVGQALFPALAAGASLGAAFTIENASRDFTLLVSLIWILFYGCALHAAGFFMPRGIKFFGCIYVASSCLISCGFINGWINLISFNSCWLMGFFFGVLHLGYGAYLYLTEKKNPVA